MSYEVEEATKNMYCSNIIVVLNLQHRDWKIYSYVILIPPSDSLIEKFVQMIEFIELTKHQSALLHPTLHAKNVLLFF